MGKDGSIEVNVRNSADLFQQPIRYVVPPYQRRYVWTEDDQWDPLWEDVSSLAERHLEATQHSIVQSNGRSNHFLGAVVVQQEPQPTGDIDVRLVIDGQQRLTTLQLLLDAAQEEYEHANQLLPDADQEEGEHAKIDLSRRLNRLVENDPEFVEAEREHLKVWPTRADQDAFRLAMRNDLTVPEKDDSPIVEAHSFFRNKVHAWIHNDDEEVDEERMKALYEILRKHLLLVVIDLDHDVDPQVIFETLNARGTPLLQSDLIKNYIIFEAQSSGHDADDVADRWLSRYSNDWWTTEVQQGRIRRQRVEQFLNYWLTMRTADEVLAGDVFQTFRAHASQDGASISEVVRDMNAASDSYVQIVAPSDESLIAESLRRFEILDVGVVSPVLMWLMANVASEDHTTMERAVRALESYLVRRAVCGRTSMGLNRVMQETLRRLSERGTSAADEVVVQHLAGQTVERRSWPSDDILRTALVERPLYGALARRKLAMVLRALAADIATPKNESLDYSSLTVEHVMPQKWRSEEWPAPQHGIGHTTETPETARDRLIHTIGNLTLVTGPLNAALSNNPWPEKRAEIEEHSNLPINRDLVKEAGDVWDEQAIIDRGQRLAEIAIHVWPGPGQI